MSDNTLIIFIKNPEPGFVKTRLAEGIGDAKAASLYRLFVEAVLKRTEDKNFKRIVFYHPPEKKHEIIDWIGANIELLSQKGDDLGERLSNAFKAAFKRNAGKVIVIGSDSPTIEARVILRAFSELKKKDCVIGPSEDGGYYLIGLSSFRKEIFQGVAWSTNRVFDKTIDTLKNLNLSFNVLDKNFDVDTAEDLTSLKEKLTEAGKINPKALEAIFAALSKL